MSSPAKRRAEEPPSESVPPPLKRSLTVDNTAEEADDSSAPASPSPVSMVPYVSGGGQLLAHTEEWTREAAAEVSPQLQVLRTVPKYNLNSMREHGMPSLEDWYAKYTFDWEDPTGPNNSCTLGPPVHVAAKGDAPAYSHRTVVRARTTKKTVHFRGPVALTHFSPLTFGNLDPKFNPERKDGVLRNGSLKDFKKAKITARQNGDPWARTALGDDDGPETLVTEDNVDRDFRAFSTWCEGLARWAVARMLVQGEFDALVSDALGEQVMPPGSVMNVEKWRSLSLEQKEKAVLAVRKSKKLQRLRYEGDPDGVTSVALSGLDMPYTTEVPDEDAKPVANRVIECERGRRVFVAQRKVFYERGESEGWAPPRGDQAHTDGATRETLAELARTHGISLASPLEVSVAVPSGPDGDLKLVPATHECLDELSHGAHLASLGFTVRVTMSGASDFHAKVAPNLTSVIVRGAADTAAGRPVISLADKPSRALMPPVD